MIKIMDPYILEWSKTPQAQPYMEQARAILGGSNTGGFGAGGQDQYGQYLYQLINANQGNPSLQKELLGYYLDYTNPFNQAELNRDEGAERDRKINAALSLMSSDDDTIKNMGLTLFLDAFPELTNTNQTGYGGISTFGPNEIPQTYEDIVRQKALKALQDYETLTEDQFNWNKYLATQATPEQINAYTNYDPTLAEVFSGGDVNMFKNALSGVGTGAAIGAGIGSIVPVVGTGFGAAVGGAGGGIYSIIKTLLDIENEKEEMRRAVAGYNGYGL